MGTLPIQEVSEAQDLDVDGDQLAADNGEKSDGKLVMAEEVDVGHVSWAASMSTPSFPAQYNDNKHVYVVKLYLRGLGGKHPVYFFIFYLLGLSLLALSMTIQTWYLGYWASQYEVGDPSQVPVV